MAVGKLNLTVVVNASTLADVSTTEVFVGPNDAVSFMQSGLTGAEEVDIEVKVADTLWEPLVALSTTNKIQRLLGPAIYRSNKPITAQLTTISFVQE